MRLQDLDGISIIANSLTMRKGTRFEDAFGNEANLHHAGLPDNPYHRVDSRPVGIRSVDITSDPGADQTYRAGDVIEVTVSFKKPVSLTGTPTLTLFLRNYPKTASCAADTTDRTKLICSYTVVTDDLDLDGISIAGSEAILENLDSASIRDASGRSADFVLIALDLDQLIVVEQHVFGVQAPRWHVRSCSRCFDRS